MIKRMVKLMIVHPIPPLYNENSRILVLGSFPSVKSRESMFFYGHPQNRFWKVISAIFKSELPGSVEEKKELLLLNGVAVWDVIASCEIQGSSDTSIKEVVPNNLSVIMDNCNIRKIFVNGKTAERYYKKYTEPFISRKAIYLPSTSPANAAWSEQKLIEKWSIIKTYLNGGD